MNKNFIYLSIAAVASLSIGCSNENMYYDSESEPSIIAQSLDTDALEVADCDSLEEPEKIIPAVLDTASYLFKCWEMNQINLQSNDVAGADLGLMNTLFDLRDTPVRIFSKTGKSGRYFTAKRKKYKKGLKTHYASVQAIFEEKRDTDKDKESSQIFYLSYVPLVGEYTIKTNFYHDSDDYYMVPGYKESAPNDYFIFGSTAGAGAEGEYEFKPVDGSYFNIETLLVGSDDPENPSQYNVWNYSWENEGSKSHLAKYRNLDFQKFCLEPVDEYEVLRVEYHDDMTAQIVQMPDFVAVWEYQNYSSVAQQMSTRFTSSATETSSFSNTKGISVSVSASISVGVPNGGAGGSFTVNNTVSDSYTWGASETKTDTRDYNFPIVIPPYRRIVAEAHVTRYKLNVGYTTYLKNSRTGEQIRLDGRWEGIDCAEIKAKCKEYELDSENILSTKTFNTIPNEPVEL